jgi:hypothetical protein
MTKNSGERSFPARRTVLAGGRPFLADLYMKKAVLYMKKKA